MAAGKLCRGNGMVKSGGISVLRRKRKWFARSCDMNWKEWYKVPLFLEQRLRVRIGCV